MTKSETHAQDVQYFTVENYYEYLDNDKDAVAEILQLVIESYKSARSEISAAMNDKDLAKFEFQAHRIKNSMEILNAVPLKDALDKARRALTDSVAAAEYQKALSGITETLTTTIEKLQPFTKA